MTRPPASIGNRQVTAQNVLPVVSLTISFQRKSHNYRAAPFCLYRCRGRAVLPGRIRHGVSYRLFSSSENVLLI